MEKQTVWGNVVLSYQKRNGRTKIIQVSAPMNMAMAYVTEKAESLIRQRIPFTIDVRYHEGTDLASVIEEVARGA